MQIKGKAWKFGKNIDTDAIIPARYCNTADPEKLAPHCLEDADPTFINKMSPGDIVVAEENFGCGSSREVAPITLKAAGVSAVVAKSFARIFFRNSINIGLPIFESAAAVDGITEGDEISIDPATGVLTNHTQNTTYHLEPFPEFLQDMIKLGGLRYWVEDRLKSNPKSKIQNPKSAEGTQSEIQNRYRIGVIGGDGIGPEVVREGLKVLKAVAANDGFSYETVAYPYCSEYYLKTGELAPESAIEAWKTLDAVYLGAIGHPEVEPGLVERSVIMGLRFGLDLYINLRPIKLYAEHLCPLKGVKPGDVDIVVVRENTEDVYAQIGGIFKKGTPDEVAIVNGIYTRKGVERAVRYAFELARQRHKQNKVTLVDKANAIRPQDIWTRVFAEVGQEYPDIERDHAYVDAACMWLIKSPQWFDVIVTPNLFGDIITDLGAMIQGGMGIAASGNIHPGRTSMFEPIHGSAPKYGGKNVASPLGAIAAVAMMLDFLGEKRAACRIERAIESLLVSQRIPSLDARSGLATDEVGDMVVAEIENGL